MEKNKSRVDMVQELEELPEHRRGIRNRCERRKWIDNPADDESDAVGDFGRSIVSTIPGSVKGEPASGVDKAFINLVMMVVGMATSSAIKFRNVSSWPVMAL